MSKILHGASERDTTDFPQCSPDLNLMFNPLGHYGLLHPVPPGWTSGRPDCYALVQMWDEIP